MAKSAISTDFLSSFKKNILQNFQFDVIPEALLLTDLIFQRELFESMPDLIGSLEVLQAERGKTEISFDCFPFLDSDFPYFDSILSFKATIDILQHKERKSLMKF